MAPSSSNPARRDAIRRNLAHRAGGAPDAKAIAEATLSACHQVVAQLSPVIGVKGVATLFSRSLYLTSLDFPWLVIAGDNRDSATLLASFRERLEAQETTDAAESSWVLLVTFTDLLGTLIGEALTERLLGAIWATPSSAIAQEPPS